MKYQSQFIEMFGNIKKLDLLKNHCSICSGKSIPTKYEDEFGNIAYVKVSDFNLRDNEKYIRTSSKFVSQRVSALSKQINKGCVIFAKNGAASLSNKKRLTEIECCIDMNTMSVECYDGTLVPLFLFSVFESINIASYVRQGAVPSINPNDIGSIEIPIPSISSQNEFITIVKQADKSKFGEFKSQFIEMFGKCEFNSSMKEAFTVIRNGANIKQGSINGGYPITRIETIADGSINRSKMGYAGITDDKYVSYYLRNGDILISHINSLAHIGKCALYLQENEEVIIHGMNLLCLRPSFGVLPLFALHLLRSDIIKKKIANITKPAVNQASFSIKDFCNILIFVPSVEAQQRFATIAQQADKSKSILLRKVA